MSNYTDLTERTDDLGGIIQTAGNVELEDVSDFLSALSSAQTDLEYAVNDMVEDHDELEAYQATGFDPDDVEGLETEVDDLRGEVAELTEDLRAYRDGEEAAKLQGEYDKLKDMHKNQAETIRDQRQALRVITAAAERALDLGLGDQNGE